jgi:lambda repressor-like predicted transcriptional regulator
VTATKSWGQTLTKKVGREDANQVAAPTETRTPTWHRANIAHRRVRMEGWRQRQLGTKEKTLPRKRKTDLTRTGLLMEGHYFRVADHPEVIGATADRLASKSELPPRPLAPILDRRWKQGVSPKRPFVSRGKCSSTKSVTWRFATDRLRQQADLQTVIPEDCSP